MAQICTLPGAGFWHCSDMQKNATYRLNLSKSHKKKSRCIALGSNPSLDWAETCQYSKMDVWKGVGGVWSCLWKATRTAYLSYPLATLLPLDVDIWRGCMMLKARMRQCWGPQGFSPKHERTKLKDWLLTLLTRRWRAAGVSTGAAKVPNPHVHLQPLSSLSWWSWLATPSSASSADVDSIKIFKSTPIHLTILTVKTSPLSSATRLLECHEVPSYIHYIVTTADIWMILNQTNKECTQWNQQSEKLQNGPRLEEKHHSAGTMGGWKLPSWQLTHEGQVPFEFWRSYAK